MGPSGIVEAVDISADGGPCLRDTGVGPQIHLLVFDGPPQALDEEVVSPGAFPIHADLDLVLEQQAGEGDAGELGALIGVEDLGLAISGKSLLDRLETELRFQRNR
jgi:hypothetical protein